MLSRNLPAPRDVALFIAASRVTLGALLLAAPVPFARALGIDSATAKRMAFLVRMAAARDVGLGAGALTADGTPAASPWLVAGAAADAVDCVAIAGALRAGTARGFAAWGVVVGAAAAAGAGIWAGAAVRRA